MANPLIDQGTLNLLRASVVFGNNATLNITAPYLGKEGIKMRVSGQPTIQIPTLTGIANSPQPYVMLDIEIHLLKTQGFADVWKKQTETATQVGPVEFIPDSKSLSNYQIENCSIVSVADVDANGSSAEFLVRISGAYYVNSSLWTF